MALYPEPATTSSYSDPIYDRIDVFAQALKRRWYIYALALIVIVLLAQLARVLLLNRPGEASSTTFVTALDAQDPATRTARLQALAADDKAAPYFRARAQIELVQDALSKDETATAKAAAAKAVEYAKMTDDFEVQYSARLSLAAAEYQAKEYDAAIGDYAEVEKAAKGRFQHVQIEAVLGGARALVKAGKPQDAIAKLEPWIARSDSGAQDLLDVARVMYWRLIYLQSQPAPAPDTSTASATAAAIAPAPAPAATPAPEPAPAPAPAAK
ncbi:MAG: hypothetical protein H0V44_00655 [Planctomycetes bacterium]|nr:hypothetical protein [Planctomycetota bacterium]